MVERKTCIVCLEKPAYGPGNPFCGPAQRCLDEVLHPCRLCCDAGGTEKEIYSHNRALCPFPPDRNARGNKQTRNHYGIGKPWEHFRKIEKERVNDLRAKNPTMVIYAQLPPNRIPPQKQEGENLARKILENIPDRPKASQVSGSSYQPLTRQQARMPQAQSNFGKSNSPLKVANSLGNTKRNSTGVPIGQSSNRLIQSPAYVRSNASFAQATDIKVEAEKVRQLMYQNGELVKKNQELTKANLELQEKCTEQSNRILSLEVEYKNPSNPYSDEQLHSMKPKQLKELVKKLQVEFHGKILEKEREYSGHVDDCQKIVDGQRQRIAEMEKQLREAKGESNLTGKNSPTDSLSGNLQINLMEENEDDPLGNISTGLKNILNPKGKTKSNTLEGVASGSNTQNETDRSIDGSASKNPRLA